MGNLKHLNREELIKRILENSKKNPEYRKIMQEKIRKIMQEKARKAKIINDWIKQVNENNLYGWTQDGQLFISPFVCANG